MTQHIWGIGAIMTTMRRVICWVSLGILGAWGCGDGRECSSNENCAVGTYCVNGKCESECDRTLQNCDQGVCTRHGRCALDQPDPTAGVCAARVIEAEFGTPNLVILVDQSGSMDATYSGGTRWTVLRDALMDPTTGIVPQFESVIRFGLTLYSGGGTCPALTVVDPALNNAAAIDAVYQNESPLNDTPTGESIDAVVQTLQSLNLDGPDYIIVATDGEPDTCAEPNPQNGQPEAVAAAQNAYGVGIPLFFLSVGVDVVSQAHMQDMANAGVGYQVAGPATAPYYEAGDATELAAAFAEITDRILTCELTVNGQISSEAANGGIIYVDGNPLPLNSPNGWEPVNDTTFRLLGDACDQVQRAGAHTVTASFGCDETGSEGFRPEGGGLLSSGCASSRHTLAGVSVAAAVWLFLRRRRRRSSRNHST